MKEDTLFRHAKDVEPNFKKTLSICLSSSSPYKFFDGTYPSGTDWTDYLMWIRKEMNKLNIFVHIEDIIDEDIVQQELNSDSEDEQTAIQFFILARRQRSQTL